MKKYISVSLIGIFQLFLIYSCVIYDISGKKRMIDTPDILAEIVDQAAVLYSDSEDEGNGQCLRDLYGVILEIIDEDEIIIQESGKEDSVITVKGNNSKSVIKNARTGDKVKVTYLVKRRADFNPSKIYLSFNGELKLLE